MKGDNLLNNVREQIDDLYNLFAAAKEFKHGIKKHSEWAFFEPTKFIYAFFTFNSLYSIDWKDSVLQKI